MPSSSSSSGSSSSSSSRKRRASVSTRKSSILKNKNNGTRKIKKRVRISSPRNETRTYSLGSEEKQWKQGSPQKTGVKCGQDIFPCVYRGVVFENIEEWDEFMENSITRNSTTGYRPVSSHRKSTMSSLSKTGKRGKRIPEEWRIYNTETGEVFDMRDLESGVVSTKSKK
jgi:hypothetical protein